jgi:tRNA G46 methylase TrmB
VKKENELQLNIKLTYLPGLKSVVLAEVARFPKLKVVEADDEVLYLEFFPGFKMVKKLRSILNAYIIKRSPVLHTRFISNHKSILGDIVEGIIDDSGETFKTFKLSCAGVNSPEAKEIRDYIILTYKLAESESADMEIYIGKSEMWEVGVRITARPLSLRDYKVANIPGGMNPTIAYAMNSFCHLEKVKSYLNICSGSATLLIEAGLINPDLKLLGFDNNGKSIALAVENIKRAGLIKKIQLRNVDIIEEAQIAVVSPAEIEKHDIIAADLPFGMQIAKGEDLAKLYSAFIAYSEKALNPGGTLAVYTTEADLFESLIKDSTFKIIKTLELKVSTVVDAYIFPKIFICKLV